MLFFNQDQANTMWDALNRISREIGEVDAPSNEAKRAKMIADNIIKKVERNDIDV